MLHEVFAVRNTKAKFYHQPYNVKHDSDGIKNFDQAANDPASLINKYPQDYALHHLGHFDDNTGQYQLFTSPIHVTDATELKKGPDEVLNQLRQAYETLTKMSQEKMI